MKKKSNNQTLGEVLTQLIDRYGWGDQLYEAKLASSWDNVTGPLIARHTKEIRYRKGVMMVKVDNAALKQELIYQRQRLKEELNKALKKEIVKDIIIR